MVLDNLSTHKPKRDLWLARHPNVHFHYTPTHTSWLNQIEIWFSILSGKSLKGGSFGACPNSSPTSMPSSQLQRRGPAVRLDQERRPSEADEAMFRGLTILGTSYFPAFAPMRSVNDAIQDRVSKVGSPMISCSRSMGTWAEGVFQRTRGELTPMPFRPGVISRRGHHLLISAAYLRKLRPECLISNSRKRAV